MKSVMMKVLTIGFAVGAIVFFVQSGNGIWGDTKQIRDSSSSTIESRLAPPP